MPYYLTQGSYTPEAIDALTRNPEDRGEAARGMVEKMGGRLLEFFFAQGEYDIVGIAEFPDAETANAFMMIAIKTGHLKTTKMTPLFTVEETMRAMRRAGEMTYQAPRG
jgi:uncharacterized protein with GYD domain